MSAIRGVKRKLVTVRGKCGRDLPREPRGFDRSGYGRPAAGPHYKTRHHEQNHPIKRSGARRSPPEASNNWANERGHRQPVPSENSWTITPFRILNQYRITLAFFALIILFKTLSYFRHPGANR